MAGASAGVCVCVCVCAIVGGRGDRNDQVRGWIRPWILWTRSPQCGAARCGAVWRLLVLGPDPHSIALLIPATYLRSLLSMLGSEE